MNYDIRNLSNDVSRQSFKIQTENMNTENDRNMSGLDLIVMNPRFIVPKIKINK